MGFNDMEHIFIRQSIGANTGEGRMCLFYFLLVISLPEATTK